LKLNLLNDETEKKIIYGLPNLKTLNGIILFRDSIQLDSPKSLKVSQQQLKQSKPPKNNLTKNPQKFRLVNKSKREKDTGIDHQHLLDIMNLYDKFKTVIKDDAARKEITEELGDHMKGVLTNLKINVKNLEDSDLRQMHQFKARYALCDISRFCMRNRSYMRIDREIFSAV
jgi:hypothetical protein